jgi:expansin (peptidoglycan-binding protein)
MLRSNVAFSASPAVKSPVLIAATIAIDALAAAMPGLPGCTGPNGCQTVLRTDTFPTGSKWPDRDEAMLYKSGLTETF